MAADALVDDLLFHFGSDAGGTECDGSVGTLQSQCDNSILSLVTEIDALREISEQVLGDCSPGLKDPEVDSVYCANSHNSCKALFQGKADDLCIELSLMRDARDDSQELEDALQELPQWAQDAIGDLEVLLQNCQFQAAEQRLGQALGDSPADAALQQLLCAWRARVLDAQASDPLVIIQWCTKALEGNRHPWAVVPLALRARQHVRLNEIALAVDDYERLLAIRPRDAEAHTELCRLREVIPNLYNILQVPCNATAAALHMAYRRLALQYHPDRQLGQTDEAVRQARVKFQEVTEAFRLLSDAVRRAEYDEFLQLGSSATTPGTARGCTLCGVDLTAVFTAVGGFFAR